MLAGEPRPHKFFRFGRFSIKHRRQSYKNWSYITFSPSGKSGKVDRILIPQEALGAVVNPVLRKEEPSSKHVTWSEPKKEASLTGGNSKIFGIFTPKFGKMIQFDEHIFQMG